MSRIPPADRQSISRLLLAAALRHSLSFAISHMVAWSTVAAVHPPLPPSPLPLLPYTRPPIPVPTATKLIHRLTYLRTHIHTYYHNPRLAAFGPPAGCSTLLGACKHVQAWQETCNATSLPRPCLLHRDEWPFAALSYEIATQAQETHPSPKSRSVLCRLTSASRSVDARSHGRRRVFMRACVCVCPGKGQGSDCLLYAYLSTR